jgi:predicted dehydrogenase
MSTAKRWKFAVIGFDHMHAGDFVNKIVGSRNADLVGVWDSEPARLERVSDDLGIPVKHRFRRFDELIGSTGVEIAAVCSTTKDHPRWVRRLADSGVHVILEKPFATSLAEADEMISAASEAGLLLAINWPLAWYPPHRTTQRLISEGVVGQVREIHYYDGNRGPLRHVHGKREVDASLDAAARRATWWYQAENGGGSLLDYLGYGATLSTWFRGGELPTTITAQVHVAPGDEVDEQSVVIAGFPTGLSTFQTRWGTFTDPWTHQPQPRCGFVVVGGEGTISSFDYQDHVTLQTADHPDGIRIPVDDLAPESANCVDHVASVLSRGAALSGPLSVEISRAGQQIVDSARESARIGRTVDLLGAQPRRQARTTR